MDGLAPCPFNFSPTIEIGLSLNVRKARLPKSAAQFFAEAGKKSPLWARIPEDALFACRRPVPRRIDDRDARRVLDGAESGGGIGEARRRCRGRSWKRTTSARWPAGSARTSGSGSRSPDAADKTWCRRAMLAVKTADNQDGRQAEAGGAEGSRLPGPAGVPVRQGASRSDGTAGRRDVRYLTPRPAFPPGFRPAFASKGGYLLVAGSPQTIARFNPPTGAATAAEEVPILPRLGAGVAQLPEGPRQGLADTSRRTRRPTRRPGTPSSNQLMPLSTGSRIELGAALRGRSG